MGVFSPHGLSQAVRVADFSLEDLRRQNENHGALEWSCAGRLQYPRGLADHGLADHDFRSNRYVHTGHETAAVRRHVNGVELDDEGVAFLDSRRRLKNGGSAQYDA